MRLCVSKAQKRRGRAVDLDADARFGVAQFRPAFRHAEPEGRRDEKRNRRAMFDVRVLKQKGFGFLAAIVGR